MRTKEHAVGDIYYLENKDLTIGARYLVKIGGKIRSVEILEKSEKYIRYTYDLEESDPTWIEIDHVIGESGWDIYDSVPKK